MHRSVGPGCRVAKRSPRAGPPRCRARTPAGTVPELPRQGRTATSARPHRHLGKGRAEPPPLRTLRPGRNLSDSERVSRACAWRCGYIATRAWLDCAPDFRGKKDALGHNAPQSGPKCQGGGGTTAYVVRPHAPDGAPTIGTPSRAYGLTTYTVIPSPPWHLGPNCDGFEMRLKLLEAKIARY